MPIQQMNRGQEKAGEPDLSKSETAGQILKKIFHQDYRIPKIDEQLASESMLMNPFRLRMFIALCESPCEHIRSMARMTGKSISSVKWNLGQLLDRGYLESCTVDGKKVYWPTGMAEKADIPALSMLRVPWAIQILRLVHENGSLRQKELVTIMGENQQLMEFRLRKMVGCGILDSPISGTHKSYLVSKEFIGRVEFYNSRARDFSRELFDLLKKDGLIPKSRRFRNTRLSLEVRLPSGKRRIHLECDAMAAARKILGRRL